jgi:hypothetical protein
MALKDVETFIVTLVTVGKWQGTGGPAISGGIYAMAFRAKRAPSKLPQAGVMVTKNATPSAAAKYFVNTDVTRERIDAAGVMTGANGTALTNGITLADNNSGTGALPAECMWSIHKTSSIPFVIFIQILRPVNAPSMTCPL